MGALPSFKANYEFSKARRAEIIKHLTSMESNGMSESEINELSDQQLSDMFEKLVHHSSLAARTERVKQSGS